MALQSMNKVRWQYVDDKANKWSITATKAITDQGGKVGGIAADGTEVSSWPRGWRPRKAYFSDGTTIRAVVIYTAAALAALTEATTLTLNKGADIATFTHNGSTLGEKKRSATKSST